jgi:hypothetical protein
MNENCPHCGNRAPFLAYGRPVALAAGWHRDVRCDVCQTTRVLPCAAPGDIPTTGEPTREPQHVMCRCETLYVRTP